MDPSLENPFKIRLTSANAVTIEQRRAGVVFEVTPELNEARSVQYDFLDPVHAPGQIAVYKRTNSRRFSLTAVRLMSRTPAEASTNLAYLWALRGWTVPNFGIGTSPYNQVNRRDTTPLDTDYIKSLVNGISAGANGSEYLGAPPSVLELSAYSRRGAKAGINSIGHLHRVPVVIDTLNIFYPSDVDYIPTDEEEPTPMPVLMTVDITLIEAQSPTALSNFSLSDYRVGNLKGF